MIIDMATHPFIFARPSNTNQNWSMVKHYTWHEHSPELAGSRNGSGRGPEGFHDQLRCRGFALGCRIQGTVVGGLCRSPEVLSSRPLEVP